jgi:hypothetical protein
LTSHITQTTRVPPLDFSRLDESRPQWRCLRLLYDLGHPRQRRSDVAERFDECFEAYGRQSGLVPYWPLPESPAAPPLWEATASVAPLAIASRDIRTAAVLRSWRTPPG